MRHRFHSICPYFAMFPETFVEKHLAATKFDGVVFDPFCGRGTTVFESLMHNREAAGCDIHPVAVCISGAKSDPPEMQEVTARIDELEEALDSLEEITYPEGFAEFFALCFEQETYRQVAYLRARLCWQSDRTDRFIAALCLGALHGESHRSPNYFSNRMPRTISTKPAYSIRWWQKHGYRPPARDVFSILRHVNAYRYRTPPPKRRGKIVLSDARKAGQEFPKLVGQVTDVITSPPYLDTTNYHEDQWLRLWFLGGNVSPNQPPSDGRHYSAARYWTFLQEAWTGLAPLVADRARMVIRIGGRKLEKADIATKLIGSLEDGMDRTIQLVDGGVTSSVKRTQANTFRGSKASPTEEHDFCLLVS